MRHDRWVVRAVKVAILFGVLSLSIEGLFELKLVVLPFVAPPSVPGQSKIIEHFVVQHLAFPVIGMLLVFAPLQLERLFHSRLATGLVAVLALLVTIPEALVSRTDLFRPYPFQLHSGVLKSMQMLDLGSARINLLQAQHLLFAHFALMGTIIAIAVGGVTMLHRLAGPRTGEAVLA